MSLRRALIAAALLAGGVVAACTGGGSFATGSGGGTSGSGSVGRGGGATGSSGTSGGGQALPPEVDIPHVACVSSIEPSEDAGELDAGDADASIDGEEDAGVAASPCDAPPRSTCLTKTAFVEFGPGPCIDEQCRFSADIIECPGGCFQQLDGGEHCNRGN